MGLTTGPNGARAAPQKSLRRVWQRGGRGSKVKHRGGTMESEQSTPASSASSSTGTNTSTTNSIGTTSASTASIANSTSSSSTSSGRLAIPQISVYSGIPDRQTVQVIQQALHRQPSTAAQYLQQMYAAQQQHLMLQTAALQQQHLSTAQLQSLAAVQQASLAAGRQSSNQNGTLSTQSGSSQTTINLTTSPAAAQLISRAQSVNSTPSGISQQAVLLGNATSSTLTASQAQMYLRAQMAQQSNLVHVARSLGRAVPLSPQLILAPTATVTALQSDTNTANNTQSVSAQVQNLALRNQQGVSSTSQSSGLQALSLKQTPVSIQPTPLIKTPSQSASSSDTGKSNVNTASADGVKKGEEGQTEMKAVNMSRNVSSSHPLLAPAYAQIQPQALIKQQPQQFVIQPQAPPTSRTQPQLLQTVSVQPHQQTASLAIQSSTQTTSVAGIIPVLPKPALHNQGSAQSQQATIFHSTVSHHALAHTGLAHAKAQPVQLTAINLQIQPAQSQSSRLAQDDKEKPTSLVVRELCPPVQMQPTTTTQGTDPPEQSKADTVNTTSQTQGSVETARDPTAAPVTPTMTSAASSKPPPAAVTGSVAQNGENKPPQAIVKPHVLTHVIEGFVIQEGAEPFPVERPLVQADSPKKPDTQLRSDPEKMASSNSLSATNSDMEEAGQQDTRTQEESEEPKLTCELCGWVDFAYKFKRSKRFCSMVCAKRYSVSCTKRVGLFHPNRTKTTNQINQWRRRRSHSPRGREAKKQRLSVSQQSQGESISSPLQSQPSQGESSPCSDISSYEDATSPLSAASSGPIVSQGGVTVNDPEELPLLSQHFLPCDPTKWNVQEVFEFIRSLPGCQEIADEFRVQEIDGQAMLLLKEDHLMSAMNIKLGPALKIFARINMLKDSKP
ncbi:polyhomeotic-like protein 2 isoform X1 [Sinocyclocheilus anshuiensis]|uniref:polyhomeotic-like protein 2 isoform X1 n=1 Tax=Sinocyclocheilus anshuiensis TaxID=1608454 RepID=UPI0007B9372E|nr:PREDICTED: polyhomeotic-like protein 2 isoform X1 [Sinocyclocheilus anshuiensis]